MLLWHATHRSSSSETIRRKVIIVRYSVGFSQPGRQNHSGSTVLISRDERSDC